MEGSCGRRLQESGHGPGDGSALNEVSLPLEDVFRIRVETDDEASRHPKALTLDEADHIELIAPQILVFLGFCQGRFGGTLDPDEDIIKVRLDHALDQLPPLSEIDRGLGVKQERKIMRFLPLFQALGQFQSALMVTDKIVVHDED